MTKVIAIHQPNFFPWLGYFNKIARADIFVFLDDVQFPKTGGVWCNRVKLLVSKDAHWLTAAIDRNFSGTRNINEMHFSDKVPWRKKTLKTIEANYRRHPFYIETMAFLEPLLLNPESNIAEYNIHIVTYIAQKLGLDIKKLKRSSDFPAQGSSNELLCSLTALCEGSVYMCGGGADGYQDEKVFKKHKIKLQYQNFDHPVYPQKGEQSFVPGLSVIDAIMNLGWDGVGDLLLSSKCSKVH